MFENFKTFKTTYCDKELTIETGKMAGLANGACLVRYGETAVLCTATMSDKPRDGIDFFPLSVDFEEKLYAAGKIPGSFLKREGRPSENAILASRVVDRPLRPLFPNGLRNDVAINMLVLSVDPDHDPVISGMIGSSIALSISDIPFNGPLGGVVIGLVDGEIVFNPSSEQHKKSDMYVTLGCTKEKVIMIEAEAKEIDDQLMIDAIKKGHEKCKEIIEFISSIQAEIGKEKLPFEEVLPPQELMEALKQEYKEDVEKALDTDDKTIRDERLAPIVEAIHNQYDPVDDADENAVSKSMIDECIYNLQKYIVRQWLLEGKRVDGRTMDEIRPLAAEVGLLPRVHGSGMFSRGQTQVLTIATLGAVREGQLIDGITEETEKLYMHHYNFPSYSVGETRPSRGPGRREIGHGALAEKALVHVLPSKEEFPYSYRLVSEVLSSNGSTSQAAVCGSTLALMDAGVPIKAPVAGISCGLITKGDEWKTFIDIQGIEDFYGDMDFKVAGTKKGITAIQVDIKNDGLTMEIIESAIMTTKKGRYDILDNTMLPVIAEPRKELSKYAPKMLTIKINPDKIREVIGSGGKVIQKITEECGVKIDIEDDGSIFISGVDIENAKRALNIIETIANDPEIGAIYKGKVVRIMPFGAFVEIAPGKDGLVHISQLDNKRVEKVEDVINIGDVIYVKVMEIDEQNRINLSKKEADKEIANKKA